MSDMITYRPSRSPYFPEARFFEDFMRPFFRTPARPAFRVDVIENDDSYILEAELPGVKRDSITVNMNEGILTIRAEWNEAKKDGDCKNGYILSERRSGMAERSFRTENIAEEGVTARYTDGILTLTLPKAVPAKKEPLRIEIQ